jgi:hypothetical protein
VWRTLTFSSISTDRVRILVKGATSYGFSFVAEVEAWTAGTGETENISPTVSLTSPTGGSSYSAPATISMAANAVDSDGSVAKVEFYAGSTKIGEDLSAPYAMSWSGVAAGTYTLTAVATDNQGARTTSSPVTVTVNAAANQAPSVSLTSPASASSFTAPASVALAASASDSDGSVAKVEFYAGSTKIGEDLSAPYALNWNGVGAGSYTLTAVATDNLGATRTSTAVTITVNPSSSNQAPSVSLTSPTGGSSFTEPASISLSANAADSDGSVAKVEFYAGSTKIGEDLSAPYTLNWSGVTSGNYTLTAVATDNLGATTTSVPVTVSVIAAPGGQAVNVALKSNGGVASASSIYSPNHPAAAVNDGVRNSKNLGKGGVWVDQTYKQYPDWIQVSFNGLKTINRIDVITTADNIAGTEPTPSTTFTLYGITSYDVQYWTGSAWATVPNGSVTGNNLVWRTLTFSSISTDRVRILVKGATSYGFSFVAEVEAWTP